MKTNGTNGAQKIHRFLEVLSIAFIVGLMFYPQWQNILHPVVSVGIVFYSIVSVTILVMMFIGSIAMWIAAFNNPNVLNIKDELTKALNKTKPSIWKKIKSALINIFSYIWRLGTIIFFAYSGHYILSGFNVIYLFLSIFMFWLLIQFKHQLKDDKKDPPEESPEKGSECL